MTIAIIGAGMAGLACAQTLAAAGMATRVFDKGRGPGGRMSTRRIEPWQFDHGAQYLTVGDPAFREQVSAWEAVGLVQPWRGRFVDLRQGVIRQRDDEEVRYVGVPRMSAILRHVAQRLEVKPGAQVKQVVPDEQGWCLADGAGTELGVFASVLLAVPAPQAVELLAAVPGLAERAAAVTMTPCWAVMLGFAQPLALPFDAAFVEDSPLAWAARNNSKPGRPAAESWVLHATGQWSIEHTEAGCEQVCGALLAALGTALGGTKLAPVVRAAHRWRFATPAAGAAEACLYDAGKRLGACGDWCLGSRVEAAWLSGQALAARVLAAPSG